MSAWDTEFAPPNLAALADQARRFFGLGWSAIGMIGDRDHTYGAHRSRRWINTLGDGSGDYTNQLALDRVGGNDDWVSALDISLDPARMKVVTKRMMDALRRNDPGVSSVREVFGTLDGRTVTGWDAAKGRLTASDDSHLFHIHITFYRSRANNDHSGVLRALTTDGGNMAIELNTVVPRASEPAFGRTVEMILADVWRATHGVGQDTNAVVKRSAETLDAGISAIREDISALTGGNVDIPALVAALEPSLRAIVADELSKLTLKAQ